MLEREEGRQTGTDRQTNRQISEGEEGRQTDRQTDRSLTGVNSDQETFSYSSYTPYSEH